MVNCFSCTQKTIKNVDNGYFKDMPYSYIVDSLNDDYADLFRSLKTFHYTEKGISYLEFQVKEDNVIAFNGFLKLYDDTIFYSKFKNIKGVPFLYLKLKRFKKWKIDYSSVKTDSISYIGKFFDKEKNDSLDCFLLTPQKRNLIHYSYVKFIAISNGGIQYLTFSNFINEKTIRLKDYPKVTYSRDYY
jgi:hypothetical protein